MNTPFRPLPTHFSSFTIRAAILSLCFGAILAGGTSVAVAEDPDVARARAEAHREYEAKKAAEKRQAIALTRQGVVSIYNPTTGPISFSVRWLLWDGSYSAWNTYKIEGRKSLYYSKAGGIKLQIKFSSTGGGQKNYALESAQIPSDIEASFNDGRPNEFVWGPNSSLDLFKGKPKNW